MKDEFILITGVTGFIGSNLATKKIKQGYQLLLLTHNKLPSIDIYQMQNIGDILVIIMISKSSSKQ